MEEYDKLDDIDREDDTKPTPIGNDNSNQEDLIMEAKNFFNTQKKQLGLSAKSGDKVVHMDFNELAEQSPELSERLIIKPEDTLALLEIALQETNLVPDARVRLSNLSPSQVVKIRNIRAKNLNSMICIEGIVRQASEVRPRVTNAKFECPACGTILSVLQIDEKFREPSRCSCGRRGGFKELSKEMVDAQRLVIEESPDALSGGEQPKRMQIFLKEDLVEPRMEEKTTPGSKVMIIGVLKEIPLPAKTGGILTRFDLAVEANNISPMEESFEDIKVSEEDEQQIRELAADPEVMEKISASIAPSVWGYKEIKQALALQLFGGVQKRRSDGTQTRGDLHILLVGDPGVAKSVMLKFISGIAPKGRYVSGKSASGAGLTATVVKDEFLRGWALEAGAMVLSNKGLVCIDELEKMDENDRSTMHEAMEQQTVTISKANVQACYSDDTQVLTEEGWKRYSEVGNLKIAQFNPKTKEIKFLSHKGLFVYNYNKEMFHFKDKRNDILVTPNHKMLFREPRQKEFQALPAEEIKYKRIEFLNSGRYDAKGLKEFILPAGKHKQNRKHEKYVHQHEPKIIPIDLWLEFLGYYVSEGGTETLPTVSITQKAGKNAEKIEKCLKKLAEYVGFTLTKIPYREYFKFKITNTQLSDYLMKNCGRKVQYKKIPLNLTNLSKDQLQILFDALMLGDGDKNGKSFGSTSELLSDQVQMMGLLLGKSTSKHLAYKGKSRGNRMNFYRIVFSDRITPQIKRSSIKKIRYDGKVWCFSTETGFFITRRNGKIAIQGNTLRAQTAVLAAANPKFGRFDPHEMIAKQVNLAPSLLNRFDVLFILRDIPDKTRDESIAAHVLHQHKQDFSKEVISQELLRKYISFAKMHCHPVLSDEAIKKIKNFYVTLRNQPTPYGEGIKPIPISARQLEALIRLAEATAKTRLGKFVSEEDAEKAINLMKFYMMQVGYDDETKSFDIDKISGNPASKRNKIYILKEIIEQLEARLGKLIPIEEIEKSSEGKLTKDELEEATDKLVRAGDLFKPKKGYVQRM